MREKELRLALVCYGGISLAVYMHGTTREVWHLARAARARSDEAPPGDGIQGVYARLLETIEAAGLKLHVLVDILAGASAGGLNAIFLAHALASGCTLDPLTELWLAKADLDTLIDPEARPGTRMAKMWAAPIAWAAAGREAGLEADTLDPEVRAEVRRKLGQLVRSRWFEPPFSGPGFDHLVLDALAAMAAGPQGGPVLPDGQPLDLYVTVTDFNGHPERLRLNSPAEVVETEHRLTIPFTDRGHGARIIADPAELTFAARATASFPGAFPPFTVAELDAVLAARGLAWPGRDAFLARALPRHAAAGDAESAVLIDGSVLANAPFRPAIEALRNRPARREIDRRFVYLDPHPGNRLVRFSGGHERVPGFLSTILGAMSDIPREQPIRDSLEAIEGRTERVRRMRAITDAIAPEVEQAIGDALGRTFFLDSPTPARLRSWRDRAHDKAARAAGFGYASYGHLKLAGIVDELAVLLHALAAPEPRPQLERVRAALWHAVEAAELTAPHAIGGGPPSEPVTDFFRAHDLRFRVRRLRFLARQVERMEQAGELGHEAAQTLRDAIFAALAPFLSRATDDFYGEAIGEAARGVLAAPEQALARIAAARDLVALDEAAEVVLAEALRACDRVPRRPLLLAYLGFPFYDTATLPLLQGEGLDEFDPVKVDRISPDDAVAIRAGGAEATLKGVQFRGFGAFFSRAYRENDYLWGRLHGAERLIDIVASALPPGHRLPAGALALLKRDAFRAILAEERGRLSDTLLDGIAAEVG